MALAYFDLKRLKQQLEWVVAFSLHFSAATDSHYLLTGSAQVKNPPCASNFHPGDIVAVILSSEASIKEEERSKITGTVFRVHESRMIVSFEDESTPLEEEVALVRVMNEVTSPPPPPPLLFAAATSAIVRDSTAC
jgi:hypothetical protein